VEKGKAGKFERKGKKERKKRKGRRKSPPPKQILGYSLARYLNQH